MLGYTAEVVLISSPISYMAGGFQSPASDGQVVKYTLYGHKWKGGVRFDFAEPKIKYYPDTLRYLKYVLREYIAEQLQIDNIMFAPGIFEQGKLWEVFGEDDGISARQ